MKRPHNRGNSVNALTISLDPNAAGAPGRVLEGCYGTPAAAALIYQASDPTLEKIPDFYCSNEEALADMKRLADAEAEASAENTANC